MKLSLWDNIKDQRATLPPLVKGDLTGKTVIVTGANVGLGLEAAKHFARMGPGKLIVTCRNERKGKETLSHIHKETGCETVEAWVLDLADFSSVKVFSDRFEREGGGRLDILLENAGISLLNLDFTSDGWETSVQVNNLSTSLLALLLLPRMFETAEKYKVTPRIVVVTSALHYWANFEKKDVDSSNFFKAFAHKENLKKLPATRYAQTKLLNVLFVRELNERLHRKPIIVTGPNPGLCTSGLRRNIKFPLNIFIWIMEKLLARTTEEGARLIVLASVGNEEKKDKLRGAYISTAQVCEPSDIMLGVEGKKLQRKLWDDLVEELAVIDPRTENIVKEYLTEPVRA